MRQYQVRSFFIDKGEIPCPLTKCLPEKRMQTSGQLLKAQSYLLISFKSYCNFQAPSSPSIFVKSTIFMDVLFGR